MENGMWDEANVEKVRLEEKQRAARRIREAEVEKAASEGTEVETFLWMLFLCYGFVVIINLNICFCAF
jgi:hypothetical protein